MVGQLAIRTCRHCHYLSSGNSKSSSQVPFFSAPQLLTLHCGTFAYDTLVFGAVCRLPMLNQHTFEEPSVQQHSHGCNANTCHVSVARAGCGMESAGFGGARPGNKSRRTPTDSNRQAFQPALLTGHGTASKATSTRFSRLGRHVRQRLSKASVCKEIVCDLRCQPN